jgi:phage FluMu protein gp41
MDENQARKKTLNPVVVNLTSPRLIALEILSHGVNTPEDLKRPVSIRELNSLYWRAWEAIMNVLVCEVNQT